MVVDGGFIGIETAENLCRAGVAVSLVEAGSQLLPPLDPELAQPLYRELWGKHVQVFLNDAVESLVDDGFQLEVLLRGGTELKADLVVLAVGVRPNSGIARAAGLELNDRGGIWTDNYLRTSDASIYAVGDVIGVEDFVTKETAMIALAGPANKQGRIAADNIAGGDSTYRGSQGVGIVKVFDLNAAFVGLSEKRLKARGLVKGKDYESLTIIQNQHAGYYPGAVPMVLKLLFTADGGRILGAQIVGGEGVDKRIDVIATAQRLGAGPVALKELELAYAPPFGAAKDPVNMAGFTAENILRGLVSFADWDEPDRNPDAVLLDIREEAELLAYSLPGAVNIPLGELRSRIGELDSGKTYIVFCGVGVRAYNAARILAQRGFDHVKVYPGGIRFYRATHEAEGSLGAAVPTVPEPPEEAPAPELTEEENKMRQINCCGMQCPGPITEVFNAIQEMQDGELLEVSASDPGFAADIVSWCRRTGNSLLSSEERDGSFVAVIRKGAAPSAKPAAQLAPEEPKGKTIIVFDGDLDRVLASFIIANGALAMGRPVTMFFTFWGLNVLRKPEKVDLNKTPMESMFETMMPRGASRLKLSRMNMGGMGTAMMRRMMEDKHIDSLEDLMKKAMEKGIRLVACSMSMDVMGIRKEELIDGVEIGGVGTYLGDAEESDVNLFI